MNRSSRTASLKRKIFSIFIALGVLVLPLGLGLEAQESSSLDFAIEVSPNSTGTIDCSMTAFYAWNSWLQTGVEYSSSGFFETLEHDSDRASLTTNTMIATATILAINQELLWHILNFRFAPLKFSVGLAGRYAVIDSTESGYKDGVADSFYVESKELSYLRPLISASVGLKFSGVSLSGSGLFTPLVTYDATNGSIITSSNPSSAIYASSGVGFDGRYCGEIYLAIPFISPRLSCDYSIHTGVTQTNKSGDAQLIVSQRQDWVVSIDLELRFIKAGASFPHIGGSWVYTQDDVIDHPELSFANTRYRLNVGFSI
jgi:hypothetical protein